MSGVEFVLKALRLRNLVAITVLLAGGMLSTSAARFKPFAGPRPILVFMGVDPWAAVIGADTPRVVVYEDNVMIFARKVGRGIEHHFRRLSSVEMADLRKRLAPTTRVKGLKPFYVLRPGIHDLPSMKFYIRMNDREVCSTVYGMSAADVNLPGSVRRGGVPKPDVVPEELLVLHKFLAKIDYSDSRKWSPKYVEVMIWPYEYASEKSIVWPKPWPGLKSERTFRRGDSYSIFLDGGDLPELEKFLRTRKAKGAVLIDGKKWAASVRPVFPAEPVWRDAFRNR